MLSVVLHPEIGLAYIPEHIFDNLFDLDGESQIFGLEITNGTKIMYIGCMPHNDSGDEIHVPSWIQDNLDGHEFVNVRRAELDAIPRAKTIRVRVLDNALYHSDIRDEIERILYDFKFIQPNIILNIMLDKLGGYEGQIYIESVTDQDGLDCDGPALLGEEVELDMGEPLERLVEFEPEPLVEPLAEPESEPEPLAAPAAPVIPTVDELAKIREARLRRFA